MRIARPSIIVGIAVTAVLLAGCGRGQQEQSVAEQLVNAQGQTGGSGQAGGPDGATGSPDDTPSASPSSDDVADDASSDDPTSDDSSTGTVGHSESESPESPVPPEASASSTRTHSASASPRETSRPRPSTSSTRGGGGGGTNADRIKVSKCYTNATKSTGGELLIKASSSDPNATLVAYRSDGSRIGEVQNGGGGQYGGTVMPYQSKDPGACVITSSSGGSISVPTTPFKL